MIFFDFTFHFQCHRTVLEKSAWNYATEPRLIHRWFSNSPRSFICEIGYSATGNKLCSQPSVDIFHENYFECVKVFYLMNNNTRFECVALMMMVLRPSHLHTSTFTEYRNRCLILWHMNSLPSFCTDLFNWCSFEMLVIFCAIDYKNLYLINWSRIH